MKRGSAWGAAFSSGLAIGGMLRAGDGRRQTGPKGRRKASRGGGSEPRDDGGPDRGDRGHRDLVAKFRADVKPEYTGIVTDVYVTEWVKVKKGDPLAKLDTREVGGRSSRRPGRRGGGEGQLLQAEVARTGPTGNSSGP